MARSWHISVQLHRVTVSERNQINQVSIESEKELKTEITYFENCGIENTQETLHLAKKRAVERGIRVVVIASIRGKTVPPALATFEDTDIKLYFVTCDGCNVCPRFDDEMKKQLEAAGHQLIYINENTYEYPPEAELAYRRVCEGIKVAVYLSIAMTEQGILRSGEEIIFIAGTNWRGFEQGGGVDTAAIVQASTVFEYWNYQPLEEHKKHGRKIKEIICMPR